MPNMNNSMQNAPTLKVSQTAQPASRATIETGLVEMAKFRLRGLLTAQPQHSPERRNPNYELGYN